MQIKNRIHIHLRGIRRISFILGPPQGKSRQAGLQTVLPRHSKLCWECPLLLGRLSLDNFPKGMNAVLGSLGSAARLPRQGQPGTEPELEVEMLSLFPR